MSINGLYALLGGNMSKNTAWGLDYRKIRSAAHRLGERWLLTLTRLNDGKLLQTWHSAARPGVQEVRRVLAKALVRYPQPDLLWCDVYLSNVVGPECEKYGLRMHIRTNTPGGLQWNYDVRLDRAMGLPPEGSGAATRPHAHTHILARARRYWLN
jgi:hypothetical protein